jgi:hypothetical protein
MLLDALQKRARIAFFKQAQMMLVDGRGLVLLLKLLAEDGELFDDFKLDKSSLSFYLNRFVIFSIFLLFLFADELLEPVGKRFVEVLNGHDDGAMLSSLGQVSLIILFLVFYQSLLPIFLDFKRALQVCLRLQQLHKVRILLLLCDFDLRMQLVDLGFLNAMLLVKASVFVAQSIVPAQQVLDLFKFILIFLAAFI